MMGTAVFKRCEDFADWTDHQIRKAFGGKALGIIQAYRLELELPQTWFFNVSYLETFLLEFGRTESFKKEAINFLKPVIDNDLKDFPNTLYAVRSSAYLEDSAQLSFAGIFESKLNVPKTSIADAVADVWDSCYSFRAASYTHNEEALNMAIVIQTMVAAKYAGIAFSKHPSSANVLENQNIVIEFAPSAGHKISQGEITPFRLSGNVQNLLAIADVPWSNSLLNSLLVLKNHYKHEIDLEFVIDATDKFWLVQQRPISTLHASHKLDLSCYHCKYRRSLLSLDIELLIDGCSQYLAPYLEVPYQLELWMVMVTTMHKEELWIHKVLNEAIIHNLVQKIHENHDFLERIHQRYQYHFDLLLNYSYEDFSLTSTPLHTRFLQWLSFITPFFSHYYVPIFMVEALHQQVLEKMQVIDPLRARRDLFSMGIYKVDSLMELLQNELLTLRSLPRSKEDLEQAFYKLSENYGFIKCRHAYDRGYTPTEIHQLFLEIDEKQEIVDSQEENTALQLEKKYFSDANDKEVFNQFKEWMRIRNQDMEYLMYAILKTRPLFEEIAHQLGISIKHLWSSSKELILKAIKENEPSLVHNFTNKSNLVIYRSHGKTHLNHHLQVNYPSKEPLHGIKGTTVFGNGTLKAKVRKVFTIEEFKDLSLTEENKFEVLVTSMTTPDFIPYIQKFFAALITDEGGILCHAAIIAREISIPCIVGTGMATDILKDGQMVLLDFDRALIL